MEKRKIFTAIYSLVIFICLGVLLSFLTDSMIKSLPVIIVLIGHLYFTINLLGKTWPNDSKK